MEIKINKSKKNYSKIIIFITLVFMIIGFASLNEAFASTTNVKVHINKDGISIGDYTVIARNISTGDDDHSNYIGTTSSPQYVVSSLYLTTLEGDKLQACVSKDSSSLIACDYNTADFGGGVKDFYINWADRHVAGSR
jgi:hypothetical protein